MSQPHPALTPAAADLVLLAPPERRRPSHGERRRAALLEALAELLQQRSLGEIGIDEISARAGVTRSAFYFYFATKPAAVAAVMGEVFSAIITATSAFFERDHGTPRERLQESLTHGAATWHEHGNLVRALYDGAGNDPEIGRLLDRWLEQFIEHTAQRIEHERAAGRAPEGVEARPLAAVLVGMNERAFLRDLRAGSPSEQIESTIAALVDAWACTLYRDLG